MNIFMKYGVMASSGGELIPQWTKETNMNVLPINDGWTDPGTLLATLNGDGTVNIDDNDLVKFFANVVPSVIDNTKITRVEARVQIIDASGGTESFSSYFGLRDGVKGVQVDLKTDGVTLSGGTKHLVDMTQFQVIRIELDKTTEARLYVNGVLVDTVPYTSIINIGANNVIIGTNSTTTSETNYDYLYYQLDLEANPDQ